MREQELANILIIDDQPSVLQLLSEVLADEGYRVTGVGEAKAIQECLRRSRPDLVILDVYLQRPDGFDVLRDIKKRNPHLPIIIFTAFLDEPRISQADGYVIKSFDLTELKQKIANALKRKVEPQGRV
jgi:DNA-binding NtrC family response regulator